MVNFVHLRSRPRYRMGYRTAPGQRGGAIRRALWSHHGAPWLKTRRSVAAPYKRVKGAMCVKRTKRRGRRPRARRQYRPKRSLSPVY